MLASLNLFAAVVGLIYLIRNMIIFRFGTHLSFKHLKFRTCIAIAIYFMGCILYTVPRLFDPIKHVMGPDSPSVAIGWGLILIGGYGTWSFFIMAVCGILKGYTRVCEPSSRLKIERGTELISTWVYRVWTPVLPLLVSIIIGCSFPQYANDIYAFHISLIGLMFATYTYLVVFTIGLFTTEMNKHINAHPGSSSDLAPVTYNLSMVSTIFGGTMFSAVPILLLCGTWEFLRRNCIYMLLLLGFPFCLVFMVIAYQLVGKKQNLVHVVRVSMQLPPNADILASIPPMLRRMSLIGIGKRNSNG